MNKTFARDFDYTPAATVPARESGAPLLAVAKALQVFLGEEPGRLDGTECLMFAAPLHQGLYCACGAAAQTSRGAVPLCCACADLAPAVAQ